MGFWLRLISVLSCKRLRCFLKILVSWSVARYSPSRIKELIVILVRWLMIVWRRRIALRMEMSMKFHPIMLGLLDGCWSKSSIKLTKIKIRRNSYTLKVTFKPSVLILLWILMALIQLQLILPPVMIQTLKQMSSENLQKSYQFWPHYWTNLT